MEQILAVGTGEGTSSDFEVTNATTLALNDASGPTIAFGAVVAIEIKDPVGAYFEIGRLASDVNARETCQVVAAPGTYRVRRIAGTCGVFTAN